jgi:hypothetical protein
MSHFLFAKTGGLSSCEVFARAFKCTVEKMPDVITKAVDTAVADTQVSYILYSHPYFHAQMAHFENFTFSL